MSKALFLEDVLKAAGLRVETVPGWQDRGRPTDGGMLDTRALICHHTAGAIGSDRGSLGIVTNGRPGLTGPLAQLFLARSGVWIVVAAGKSNSNGVVDHVDHSNAHTINTEAEASGTDSPADWPSVQYQAYAKGLAAIALHLKLPVSKVLGHKEIAVPHGRKVDPSFDMVVFRDIVARYMDQLTTVDRGTPRPPAHAVAFKLKRVLKLDDPFMRGADVADVQKALRKAGFVPRGSRRADGSWDGVFGRGMDAAVRNYQRAKRLTVDGDVGKQTARSLGGELIG